MVETEDYNYKGIRAYNNGKKKKKNFNIIGVSTFPVVHHLF